MGRAVLLRHELPDGSAHFDWMIQRAGGLVTFRVSERIDLGLGGFRAERLPDHREAYLEYEGPVSGGRGTVRRIADGSLEIIAERENLFECRGCLGKAEGRFRGRSEGDRWVFEFEAAGGGRAGRDEPVG